MGIPVRTRLAGILNLKKKILGKRDKRGKEKQKKAEERKLERSHRVVRLKAGSWKLEAEVRRETVARGGTNVIESAKERKARERAGTADYNRPGTIGARRGAKPVFLSVSHISPHISPDTRC
jgi:hypothetical protein